MTDIQKIEKKKKSTRKLHHKTSVEPSFFERCLVRFPSAIQSPKRWPFTSARILP